MIKALENLQNGLESSKSFQSSFTNQRILNLSLSPRTKFERFHTSGICALDLDRVEERYLLSGSKDGSLCIHDMQNTTGKTAFTPKVVCNIPKRAIYSHRFSIGCVLWYPFDTGVFVSSGMDKKLKIWDANRMVPVDVYDLQYKIHCQHMSPVATHHSLIAVAMEYPHTVLVDPKSGSCSHILKGHNKYVPCVRWSPSCEYLLATGGSDASIFLWDIRCARGYLKALDQHNGEDQAGHKASITAHDGMVNGLRFTDDGLYLTSCGSDFRIRLWDVSLGKNTLVNYGLVVNNSQYRHRFIELCCNSNPPVLFVPSSNYIFVFNLFTGERINTLVGHFSTVSCVVYRSSTSQLISGASDLNILLWTPDADQENAEVEVVKEVEQDAVNSPHNSDNWSSDDED